GFLHGLSVQPQFQIQTVSVAQDIGSYQIGAKWAERIEGFGPQPLAVRKLKIPCRDVVKDRIACDVADRTLDWNLTCAPSDHNSKFRFVINLLAQVRNNNGLFRPNYGIGVHSK